MVAEHDLRPKANLTYRWCNSPVSKRGSGKRDGMIKNNCLEGCCIPARARIVSGWEAEPGQFPFQLSIRMVSTTGTVVSCGGSIIHSNWGLTAAHCTANRVTIVVRAGAVSLTRPMYIFETLDYWNHPLYNENIPGIVQPNDIGVIRFNRELVFNDYVKPIRIQRSADMNRNYADVRLTASGWGATWTGGAGAEDLNWVFLLGTTNDVCRQTFGGIVQDSTICARGYNDTTQSICQGDSGGPLTVVDEDGKVTVVGVTSFTSGAGCHAGFPGGFIRPGHYHDWYYEVTGINFDWDFKDSEESNSEESSEEDDTDESDEDSDDSESEEDEVSEESSPETEENSPETEEESAPESEEESAPESEEVSTPEPEEGPAPESEEESAPESEEESAPESEEVSTPEPEGGPAPESEEESAPESEEGSAPESEEVSTPEPEEGPAPESEEESAPESEEVSTPEPEED